MSIDVFKFDELSRLPPEPSNAKYTYWMESTLKYFYQLQYCNLFSFFTNASVTSRWRSGFTAHFLPYMSAYSVTITPLLWCWMPNSVTVRNWICPGRLASSPLKHFSDALLCVLPAVKLVPNSRFVRSNDRHMLNVNIFRVLWEVFCRSVYPQNRCPLASTFPVALGPTLYCLLHAAKLAESCGTRYTFNRLWKVTPPWGNIHTKPGVFSDVRATKSQCTTHKQKRQSDRVNPMFLMKAQCLWHYWWYRAYLKRCMYGAVWDAWATLLWDRSVSCICQQWWCGGGPNQNTTMNA